MIDYFAPNEFPEEGIIHRIKGNYRRAMIRHHIVEEGWESIPPAWLEHNLSEPLKNTLGEQAANARGGEDLPDLEDGEVEIARLSLTSSVHGEVTSLRARRSSDADKISLRMVDEYETEYDLPFESADAPLSDEDVARLFLEASPCPAETSCEIAVQSYFHPGLDELVESFGGD
jgi:hypothetical protein